MNSMHYVYILRCADDTLYTGWTTDVQRRLEAHNSGKGAKYTRSRLPVELVYIEEFSDKTEAQKREYAIKQLTRAEKESLIDDAPDMRLDSVFKYENIDLLFEAGTQSGNFIAEAGDRFSNYLDRREFGYKWSLNFPAGRYVIIVYQRCSIYEKGKQIWKNDDFLNEVGKDSRYKSPCFVVILNRTMNYKISSWNQLLRSHTLRDKDNPLQPQFFSSLETAEEVAKKYSEQGVMAAVLEWYEDYNMY